MRGDQPWYRPTQKWLPEIPGMSRTGCGVRVEMVGSFSTLGLLEGLNSVWLVADGRYRLLSTACLFGRSGLTGREITNTKGTGCRRGR